MHQRPDQCPSCGSEGIDGMDIDNGPRKVTENWACECGTTWDVTYVFEGVGNVRTP